MMLGWVLSLLVLVALVYGCRPLDRWRLRHMPGPSQLWLVGNLTALARKGDYVYYTELHKRFGAIFKVWTLGNVVVVATPALCRQLLLRNSARFTMPNLFARGKDYDFQEAGLFLLRGEKARTIRSAWHPMFHSGTLEGLTDMMHKAAAATVQRMAAAARSKEPINAEALLSVMSQQIVTAAAFGVDITDANTVLQEVSGKPYTVSKLTDDMRTFFRTFANPKSIYFQLATLIPIAVPLWRLLANWMPDQVHRAALDVRSRVIPFVEGLIREHTAAVAGQEIDAKASGEMDGRSGVAAGSFLDLLVRTRHRSTGAPLSDLEICVQVVSMIVVGQESVTNAISFCMYLLALHPDKADKLAAEIRGQPSNPDYTSLTEGFPYTEAVIQEALRLLPTGTTAMRQTDRDLILEGYKVPKGTRVMASIYAVHHDENVWPHAESFIPERHLSEDAVGAPTQPYAWLGFGDGTRSQS
ncbi:hypothetical protein WJX73_010477 [Symbiochloris irregularis]|uniref:Cytochrome P450 n=1 Tax=Symbiochloris irregularis TaxID=706552 RepID=A0AAW1P7K8_9CHLO